MNNIKFTKKRALLKLTRGGVQSTIFLPPTPATPPPPPLTGDGHEILEIGGADGLRNVPGGDVVVGLPGDDDKEEGLDGWMNVWFAPAPVTAAASQNTFWSTLTFHETNGFATTVTALPVRITIKPVKLLTGYYTKTNKF